MSEHIILNDAHARLQDELLMELEKRGTFYNHADLEDSEFDLARDTADILVVSGGSKITADYISHMKSLKLIADFGVGYDGIDLDACRERGIMVSHTPGVMKDDVADLAVGLLIACVRRLSDAHRFVKNGDWEHDRFSLTRPLTGLKVGIAGLGRIGLETAHRLEAFKIDIGYFGRHKQDVPYRYFDSLLELARWCEALIITMPAGRDTYHIVDSQIIAAIGSQGYLINVARGSLVDTKALVNALSSFALKGAGLDVFEEEPLPYGPFMQLPHMVLTPHIGSATEGTRTAMSELVLKNIDAYINGEPLPTPVPELK